VAKGRGGRGGEAGEGDPASCLGTHAGTPSSAAAAEHALVQVPQTACNSHCFTASWNSLSQEEAIALPLEDTGPVPRKGTSPFP